MGKSKNGGTVEREAGTVKFRNGVSWAGERFSYVPGQILDLPEETAVARQEAGLGEIIDEE